MYATTVCEKDKSIHDNNIVYIICSTILLTIAIDSCLLFADRHVCTNVEMQGRKWTLLPHAMSTLHYFTDVMVTWIIANDN